MEKNYVKVNGKEYAEKGIATGQFEAKTAVKFARIAARRGVEGKEIVTYTQNGEVEKVDTVKVDPETKEDRLANLEELSNNLLRFTRENDDSSLNDFLQEVALMTDIDNYNAEAETVVMMTIHAAKGLEFPVVYLVGMEESIFPSDMSSMGGDAEIEEERRLAYVAVTRAKRMLILVGDRQTVEHMVNNNIRTLRYSGLAEFLKRD